MPTKNIVLACENEDARSLVDTVNETLAEKLVTHVETRKHEIGAKLLESVGDKDQYESFDPQIQEAIDEVVEQVEAGKDVEEAIDWSSDPEHKRPAETKSKLKEYFIGLTEDSITVDSTKETGAKHLKNREAMDDEDVSKRVRYEATAKDVMAAIVESRGIAFDSGEPAVRLSEYQTTSLQTAFDNLNEENQNFMVTKLTENRSNFIKLMAWTLKATK